MPIAKRVLDFISRERRCRPFLTFEIAFELEERGVWLDMGGDERVANDIMNVFENASPLPLPTAPFSLNEQPTMSDNSPSVAETLDTKILMATSAGFLGVLGLGTLLFSPELLAVFGAPSEELPLVLIEVVGTVYLGFAMLNWMAREKLIGGIYSRPVAIGNFVHFLAGTIVLVKHVIATPNPLAHGTITAAYALFAAGFGYIAFIRGGSCS